MAKTSKRASNTKKNKSGKIISIDSRKLQALYVYNQMHPTQEQLAQFFRVSLNTIKNWLADAKEAVRDENTLEMAKQRFNSMVPDALDVYDNSIKWGKVTRPEATELNAARDALKNAGVYEEKTTIEHEFTRKTDEDLDGRLAELIKKGRFEPING